MNKELSFNDTLHGTLDFKDRFEAAAYLRSIPRVKYLYMLMHNDQPFYVGISTNWKRIHGHFAEHGTKRNPLLRRKIRSIDRKNETVAIKIVNHYATDQDMYNAEINLIRFYGKKIDKTGILTNLADGGAGKVGTGMRNRQKELLRKINTGRPKSKETLEKLSIAMKKTMAIRGGTFKGRKHSAETRAKMSANNSGEGHPQFGKPSALKGRKRSEETIKRMKEGIAKSDNACTEHRKQQLKDYWNSQPILTCPHCGKQSSFKASMVRYHFDKCKHKPAEEQPENGSVS